MASGPLVVAEPMLGPMSDGGPSLPPPVPAGASSPVVEPKKVWWKKWWVITIGVVAALLVIGALAGQGAGEDAGEGATDAPSTTDATSAVEDEVEAPATTDAAADTEAPGSTDAPEPPAETDPPATTEPPTSGDSIAGAPAGSTGDRSNPVPTGVLADIGGGYRLQVLSVTDDATGLVAAENQFNDPPPAGSRFTIVEVALGYYGFDDPQSGFLVSVQAVGSGSTQLEANCGVIPNDLDQFSDMFGGGVIRGNLCFVTTPADTGLIQVYASTGFTGDEVFLDASVTPATVADMPTLPGIQAGTTSEEERTSPTPIGTGVDVGEGWSLAVTGPASDITDSVLSENQFNEPPPEGFRFVGVPVRMEYSGDSSSNAFAITVSAVGNTNLQYAEECGVIPGELDAFGDVFAGGVVEGQVCFVVPAEDLGSMTVYAGAFLEDYAFFATS